MRERASPGLSRPPEGGSATTAGTKAATTSAASAPPPLPSVPRRPCPPPPTAPSPPSPAPYLRRAFVLSFAFDAIASISSVGGLTAFAPSLAARLQFSHTLPAEAALQPFFPMRRRRRSATRCARWPASRPRSRLFKRRVLAE